MGKLFESAHDISGNEELIRKRPYGVIEVVDGKLVGIHFRPWPKLISTVEAKWLGGWQHHRKKKNQCLMYYNRPISSPNYLALAYVVTTLSTTYQTCLRALVILDEVARIKKSDAILAEVTNARMTDRGMHRVGWEKHLPHQKGRHFIRRFYGEYPDHRRALAKIVATG